MASLKLYTFNKVNLHVCRNNKIIPDSLYAQSLSYQLINSQRKDSVIVLAETEDIVQVELLNQEFYFDLSFNRSSLPKDDFYIIYEVKNKKGELLIWQRYGINKENGPFKLFTKVSKQHTDGDLLYVKAFFINAKKERIKLHDLRLLIYRK